ncbi:hypothetical protein D9613_008237 [Agrocybe pediades]|uniref:Uncharacterized protein n=1 Tax=Agrocybe pediades TaxID=84607 RepID=A0A8H4QU99_9AGAR|nr:hypothetical protein D9613_008237 [Agrocybe pediades]
MKTTILTSFVAIALAASSFTTANVIPKAVAGGSTSAIQPAVYRRQAPNPSQLAGSLPSPVGGLASSVPQTPSTPSVPRDGSAFISKLVFPPNLPLNIRGDDNYENTDRQYLNFALFVAQLEFAFFERGLSRYSEEDFRRAGYPNWVRGRYQQIKEHEKIHLNFLESAVTTSGVENVQPCNYNFPDNDVHAFVDLSEAITQIVTSIYVGGLHFFYNRASLSFDFLDYVTVGASILAVEARQASWINSAVRKQNPWNTAFETPLSPSQGLTLLTSFFDFNSMPSINAGLLPNGLRPAAPLYLASKVIPGQDCEITLLSYSRSNDNERLYAAFLVGFETIIVRVEERRGGDNNNNGGEHHDGNGNGGGNGNGNNNGNGGNNGHSGNGSGNNNGNSNGNRPGSSNNNGNGSSGHHDKRGDDDVVKYFVRVPEDLRTAGNVYVLIVRGDDDINGVRLDDEYCVAGPALVAFPFDSNGNPISW